MKFLFTRPHALAEQLQAEGHTVVLKSVDDFPSDDANRGCCLARHCS